jgi:hypothetical protein
VNPWHGLSRNQAIPARIGSLTATNCSESLQCELVEQESEELNLSPQFRSLLEKESAKANGVETASQQQTKDLTEHGQQS